MDRRQLTLAMLACSDGMPYTPVQIQKTVFLVCRNLPDIITQGEGFAFVPYDYGPFDANVYNEIGQLRNEGLALIAPSSAGSWNTYSANDAGVARGREILDALDLSVKTYLVDASRWVRSQSFSSLVKSIYNLYPDMRANSVFQG